jgi:hypothetical protein
MMATKKINMQKKLILYIFFISMFLTQFTHAQGSKSEYLVRSSIGLSGSTSNFSINNKTYVSQQSIGQKSAIGTFKKAGYTLRQGFIQPNILAKIIDRNLPVDLEVSFYPNPFVESASLVFTEKIEGNVQVAVFNMMGKLVFSKRYLAGQKIEILIENLSLAGYILKVTANKKQFIKNIIKKSFR